MDERTWTDAAPAEGDVLEMPGVRAVVQPSGHAVMVSGDVAAAIGELWPGAKLIGLGDDIGDEAFALRIGRDRAFLVTPQPVGARTGWHAAGYGLSAADDAFCGISLAGEAAAQVVAEGTACDLGAGSRSAALLFAGQFALLARNGRDYVLWVERPLLSYVWSWLARASGTLADPGR